MDAKLIGFAANNKERNSKHRNPLGLSVLHHRHDKKPDQNERKAHFQAFICVYRGHFEVKNKF
jgi:hypothetical protein